FPRRYASIRRAVKDVREFEGEEFFATVEGRDIETGDSVTVRGRVVDLAFEATEEVASLTVETETGRVDIGGRVASLEDVEGQEIVLGRGEPPAL
ncbi:ArsR family transcriptional regulator, partial [Halorubrum sp. E3]